MYIGLYVKYPLFLPEFDDTLIFSTDFQTIIFHENPSSGSRVVLCGRIDRQTDRQTARQIGRWTDRLDEADNRFS